MWNIRKYSAMAIVGVGLAFAASSPASAQWGGWGGSGWGGAYGAGGWGGSGWGSGYGGYGSPVTYILVPVYSGYGGGGYGGWGGGYGGGDYGGWGGGYGFGCRSRHHRVGYGSYAVAYLPRHYRSNYSYVAFAPRSHQCHAHYASVRGIERHGFQASAYIVRRYARKYEAGLRG